MATEMSRDELRRAAECDMGVWCNPHALSAAILRLLDDHAALQARHERALGLLRTATNPDDHDWNVQAWARDVRALLSEPAPAISENGVEEDAELQRPAPRYGRPVRMRFRVAGRKKPTPISDEEPAPASGGEARKDALLAERDATIARMTERVAELEREAYPCPKCAGHGWYEGMGSEHDPFCDGTCKNCPVPVPIQVQCEWCGGSGTVLPEQAASGGEGGE